MGEATNLLDCSRSKRRTVGALARRDEPGSAGSAAVGTVAGTVVLALALVLTACGSSATQGGTKSSSATPSGYQPGVLDQRYAGTTISVLLPPWAQQPESQLAKFTEVTGIKVDQSSLAWSDIRTRTVVDETAGNAPADVVEVDWSWVGQYGAAGWLTPLNDLIPESVISGSSVSPAFVYQEQQLAIPYNLDFRGTIVNMTDFAKAGLHSFPTTWDELIADAQQIKKAGIVPFPIGLDLSASEDTSTGWYALTKAAGGEVVTSTGEPGFTSPNSGGAQALSFMLKLYQEGLVSPGSTSARPGQAETAFNNNQVAVDLVDSPGSAAASNFVGTPVAHNKILFIALPGSTAGQMGTFGLPEGLGIPMQSTNKGAAAMFIEWWEEDAQQIMEWTDAKDMGNLPAQVSALQKLVQMGEVSKEILDAQKYVTPLFSQGTPTWYPAFSTEVSQVVQAVAQGHLSVSDGLSKLAGDLKGLSAK